MALADFRNSIITQDKFSGTFDKFDRAVSKSARGADTAAKAFSGGGLMALAGGAAGVFAVTQIAKGAIELGNLGAQSLTTKASFENLMASVGQSTALLDSMKSAAGGTITELQLMQSANTALAGTSGALSNELAGAIPKLIEAGRAAAKLNPSMGDAAFMTQSLITGIKRGSPMLIDNTGITLKLGEANEAYAASVGKTVDELTAQETSIAILRATLAGADTLITQAGGSSRSMAEDMIAAAVATQELKTALGELLAPTIATMAGNAATAINLLKATLQGDVESQMAIELERAIELMAMYQTEIDNGAELTGYFGDNVAQTATRIRELQHSLMAAEQAERAAALELIHVANASEGARWGMSAAAGEAGSMGFAFDAATIKARGLRLGLDELRTARQTVTPSLKDEAKRLTSGNTFTGSYGSAVNTLAGTPMEWDAVNRASLGFANSIASLNAQLDNGKITVGQYQFEVARLRQGLTDTTSSFNTAGGAVDTYGDKLKGLIGQQLKPTFDLSGLTGGALGGMGGDTFDEAYKRLAAVALRPEELQIHAQDWAGTFQQAGIAGMSPEDAQAEAKRIVEAYGKGLDFSLIDWEKVKDSVRQQIKADELFASVVDQVYAEMGKPNPKADGAGYAMGKQINTGAKRAAKEGGAAYLNEFAMAVSPYVARIMREDAARYGGIPQ